MAAIFQTLNMVEIQEMHKELANNITFDTFKKILFEATKEDHNFLFINKYADDPNKQFGICFDRVFNIDLLEERRKLLCSSSDKKDKKRRIEEIDPN